MPTPNLAVTDSRFNALKTKLRELFELDKSDLDFGIYRIIAAKNKEVTEFLDRQLKDVVRQTLAAHGAGAAGQVQTELDTAIEQARALGADPETLPRIVELRARLNAAGGASAAELEADIYNHLLAFFSRYYDEGDFISQRRYKGDTYAIPYSGEEVTLHWANKDQYYIKSGEWHKDYRFKIGDKTVRFRLVEATQEVGNNKEAEDAKRRYILAEDIPVEVTPQELTLRFEFRVPSAAECDRAADGCVTVFGGDFAKANSPKKGDEREQFCADAETRALDSLSLGGEGRGDGATADWRALVTAASPTETKPARTLLGKHLDYFTARNTFDYFIHKDLGGFLRREMDFYIKNEVVRLDDLETLPQEHLHRVQGKVKAIRAVAGPIIAFLASLEDFQKKMWLKRKFVLNTNWLITLDRLPRHLLDVVATNKDQWAEWQRLGFQPQKKQNAEILFNNAEWGTRAYVDACDKLVMDTKYFDAAFVAEILASEEVLSGSTNLDQATTGVLIHSENFQALHLLKNRYHAQISCIYIDPPYNSDGAPIVYKNGYRSSSWLSLINDRMISSASLMDDDACYAIAIDDFEVARLCELCDELFAGFDRNTVVVNHHPQGGMSNNLSRTHEYMLVLTPAGEDILRGKSKSGGIEYRSFALSGPGKNKSRLHRWNSFYAVLIDEAAHRIVGLEPPPKLGTEYPTNSTSEGFTRRYPLAPDDDTEKVWCRSYESAIEGLRRGEIVLSESGALKLAVDTQGKRDSLMSNWTDSRYNSGPHGTALIANILGETGVFSYPKSLHTVLDSIEAMTWLRPTSIILDFFAGSGTTSHAVLNLNREGKSVRQFVLVEMGGYFNTVLRPRTTKIIYSPEWEGGRAQSHDKGVSALVKYFAIESYEDALNNLPAPTGTLLLSQSEAERGALINYGLDLELGPHLLNLDAFRDPWVYTINAQLAGDNEIQAHCVDLVETFNYLIGLTIHAYGPRERYSADFERARHEDGLGRLKLTGRLRRDAHGPFQFQRIEGELNDGNATRVLVVWRRLTDDPEQDAAILDAWMDRHREDTRQRTEHRDYHLIYVNGPVTLPQPTAEIRTVYPIEETFKAKMFEDTDGGAA